jgi:hypothetical protein
LLICGVSVLVFLIANSGFAATAVFGNWEDGQPDGWIDWNNGQLPIADPPFKFNSEGATVGTGAIQYNAPSNYAQFAAFKLQAGGTGRGTGNDANSGGPGVIKDYRPDFMANTKLSFDLTLIPSEQDLSDPTFNFSKIGLFLNAPGFGFARPAGADDSGFTAPESVMQGNNPGFPGYVAGSAHWDPTQLGGTQTSTWTYDITAAKAAMTLQHPGGDYNDNGVVDAADYTVWRDHLGQTTAANAYTLPNEFGQSTGVVDMADFNYWKGHLGAVATVPQYIEIIFEGFTNGPATFHIDNVRVSTPSGSGALGAGAVPEPASWLLGLLGVCGLGAIYRRSQMA